MILSADGWLTALLDLSDDGNLRNSRKAGSGFPWPCTVGFTVP
jgi:hypothetical protein